MMVTRGLPLGLPLKFFSDTNLLEISGAFAFGVPRIELGSYPPQG